MAIRVGLTIHITVSYIRQLCTHTCVQMCTEENASANYGSFSLLHIFRVHLFSPCMMSLVACYCNTLRERCRGQLACVCSVAVRVSFCDRMPGSGAPAQHPSSQLQISLRLFVHWEKSKSKSKKNQFMLRPNVHRVFAPLAHLKFCR